jgi:type II secretory pathway component GspD/PulD (secretin)
MQVKPTLSRLSDKTTDISETFRSPIIRKREAQTTVTVKDGETIVLGGLIEEYAERRDMKVPLLGDIPLIGGLFRSETETKVRTELLIVLTPHVVTSNQSTDLIDRTRELIDDLPLPQEVIDQIQRGSLDGDGGAFGSSFESVSDDSGPEGVQ